MGIGGLNTPFGDLRNSTAFEVQGRLNTAGEAPTAEIGLASADLFRVLGTPIVRGRGFTDADDETS